MKRLKSFQKVEAYLELKRASVMELFLLSFFVLFYTEWLTIFAIKAPLQMFDWVIYRPPNILKFSR